MERVIGKLAREPIRSMLIISGVLIALYLLLAWLAGDPAEFFYNLGLQIDTLHQ